VLLVRTLFVIASIVALYFLAAINLEWRQQAIFGAILQAERSTSKPIAEGGIRCSAQPSSGLRFAN